MDVGMRAILVRTGKYRPGDEELCRPAPLAVVDCNLDFGSMGKWCHGWSSHEILRVFLGVLCCWVVYAMSRGYWVGKHPFDLI